VGEPPRDLGRWSAALPLNRLRWTGTTEDTDDWNALDHPALARLSELTIERLPAAPAERVARFAPLAHLSRLCFGPTNPMPGAVRAAVRNPVWAQLRALELTGVADPNSLRAIAQEGTLEHLEELSFGIAQVPEATPATNLGGVIGAAVGALMAALFATPLAPPGPVTGADYSAALLELARSPVVPRLKRLRVVDHDTRRFRLPGAHPVGAGQPFLSDESVRALAEALAPERVERLELPAARLGDAMPRELEERFGARFVAG
jgi:hypothetical protein